MAGFTIHVLVPAQNKFYGWHDREDLAVSFQAWDAAPAIGRVLRMIDEDEAQPAERALPHRARMVLVENGRSAWDTVPVVHMSVGKKYRERWA